jgi:GDP-fucose transporter C1
MTKILKIEGSLTFFGVFFGIMASLFVALNAIYTKKSLEIVDKNIWKLTMYNNFNACVIFIPFIFLFGEFNELVSFPKLFDTYFWFAMTVSGVLGFSMSYVTSLQIQVTSPLTHNVSGTAKAYAQTLLAVFFYNEIKSLLWWMSNLLVLIGAALYSHVRNQEMKDRHNKDAHLETSGGGKASKEAGDIKEKSSLLVSSQENNKAEVDVELGRVNNNNK